ncbi:MAG: hypothetical protein ACFHX7_04460 [Pseudomonadota bacterium]
MKTDLADTHNFDLIMAGLQVGAREALSAEHVESLRGLWQEVGQVTGQQFSGIIPPDFVYHSEVACRAVEIARDLTGEPPWEFFFRLQSAFYRDGLNISSPRVLAGLLGLPEADVRGRLQDLRYVNAARAGFALANTLSANALPGVYIDSGEGYSLVTGGYVTAEFLVPELRARYR